MTASVLMSFTSALEKKMCKNFSNPFKIKQMFHTGCALERGIINETITYNGNRDAIDTKALKYVQEEALRFKEVLNISLNDRELYYICEIIVE